MCSIELNLQLVLWAVVFPVWLLAVNSKKSIYFFTCRSGAEKTRDELRMQVYDAMAEKPKEVGQESVAGLVKTDEKRENSDAQSPIKSVNGANHGAKGNGVEKSPVPPVNDVINKPATNEEEPDKDVNSNAEAEEEDEGAEGSKLYEFRALFVNGSSQMCWLEHSLGCFYRWREALGHAAFNEEEGKNCSSPFVLFFLVQMMMTVMKMMRLEREMDKRRWVLTWILV